MSRRAAAREAVISAALRVLSAERENNPTARAEGLLADEELAFAARELIEATEQLPPDERPVGWDDATAAEPQPQYVGQA